MNCCLPNGLLSFLCKNVKTGKTMIVSAAARFIKAVKEKPQRKPKANLLGIAKVALRKDGAADKIKEMTERVTASHSFDEALGIIMEYVAPI